MNRLSPKTFYLPIYSHSSLHWFYLLITLNAIITLIINFTIYLPPNYFLKSKIIDSTNLLHIYTEISHNLFIHLQKWKLTFILQKCLPLLILISLNCTPISLCPQERKLGIILEICPSNHTHTVLSIPYPSYVCFIIFITFKLTQPHHHFPKSQKLLLITSLLQFKFSL